EFVSRLQRRPKAGFFRFIEKTHFAAAVDTRLIHATNGIVGELASLHCPTQDTREREEIAQNGGRTSSFPKASCLPALDPLDGDRRERLRIPGSKMPL